MQRKRRFCKHMHFLSLLFLILLVPGRAHASINHAVGGGSPDDPRMVMVYRLFNEAEYDEVMVLLQEMATDKEMAISDKQECYRLMGLIHTMMGQETPAREALKQAIAMDPDVMVVDPDRDMLEFVRLYYEERKAYNEAHYCPADFEPPHACQYYLERPDPGIQTMAVIDFDNNAIMDRELLAPLSGGLSDLMIRLLSGKTGLQIVERERLNWLLAEIDLGQQEQIDVQTAVRVGKLLGAHTVLLGDFLYLNNTLTLGARLVKVETGEVLLVAGAEGRLKRFSRISNELSEALIEAIAPQVGSEDWSAYVPTHNLDAFRTYAEAIAALDEGDYTAAYEHLEKTLELDPNHGPARSRLDALVHQFATASNH